MARVFGRVGQMTFERFLRHALLAVAFLGLVAGIIASASDRPHLAGLLWTLATVPVVAVDGKVRFKGVVNPVLLERLLLAESREH